MINREILEGLKFALNKGQTLRSAMMSFYNAGYKKNDIEEAARALHLYAESKEIPFQTEQKPSQQIQTTNKPESLKKYVNPLKTSSPRLTPVSSYEQPKKHGGLPVLYKDKQKAFQEARGIHPAHYTKTNKILPQQPISEYGSDQPKSKKKLMLTLLILIFFCLIGILAAVFLFKEEVLTWFNNIFG